VVAQVGQITPQASALDSGFMVQGERRYWVHVSIDRYTNKIIERKMEPVYD
jgi:hypothetical protein